MVAENSSPYSGVVGLGTNVDGASPGLPIALPAEPSSQPPSHTGSPDPAALTVLQPSNGTSQHYSAMLPSFGYSTGIDVVWVVGSSGGGWCLLHFLLEESFLKASLFNVHAPQVLECKSDIF